MNNTTAMKNILKFIIPAAALITLAASCHREEHLGEFLDAKTLIVNVSAPTMDIETKSASSQVPDSIFAYPVNETLTGEGALRFNNRAEDKFYFLIPTGSTGVLFTNISGYEEGVTASSYLSPESLFEAASDTGRSIARDVLYGIISEYSSEEPEQTVSLTRAVARITPQVRLLIGEDTLDNLSSRFDSVHVTLHNVSQGLRIGQDFTVSYFGLNEFSCGIDLGVTPCAGDSTYTFPTADGAPAGITLDLFKDNRNYRLEGILPEAIMPNRDYSLTAYVRTDNTEGNFSLEDITFQEYSYVQDENEYTYSLLSFSSDNIFLNKEENSVAELVVYSETGSWSATVPADVLSYLDIANKRTGLHATTDNNVLTGLNLDTVVVTTLSDISEHPTSMVFDIPFSVSNDTISSNDVYNLPVIQSNGQRGVVDFTIIDGNTISFTGFCDLYRMDGSDSTLLVSAIDSASYLIDPGSYRLAGPLIYSLELERASTITINSSVFTELDLSYAGYLESMDFSQAPLLTSLTLNDYDDINNSISSIDLSNMNRLREVHISGFPNLGIFTTGGGLPLLQSLTIASPNVSTIDVSGCSALTHLHIDSSEPDSVILSNCSSLQDFSVQGRSIKTLHVDGCTAMRRLIMMDARSIENLEMDGADNLKEIYLTANNSGYPNTSITELDLTGLMSLDTIYISNLNALKKIDIGDGISSLKYLYARSCYALSTLNLSNCTGLLNFDISDTPIDSLIIPGCTSLQELYLNSDSFEDLEYLNMDGCSSIKKFEIYGCNNLNTLNLSGLSVMDTLRIRYCEYLRDVNLSGCNNISLFDIENLYRLRDIELDNTSSVGKLSIYTIDSLRTLDMRGWHIDTLDLSYNVSSLDTLYADNSTLSHITFLKDPDFAVFRAANTNLKVLPAFSLSRMNTLDISGTKIETLSWKNVNLSEIDTFKVNNCTSLKTFHMYNSKVSDNVIDLSGCTSLDSLYIYNAYSGYVLDTLNLSGCTSLRSARIYFNGALKDAENGLILDGARINNLYLDYLSASVLSFSNTSVIDSLYIGTIRDWDNLLNLYMNGTEIKSVTIKDMSGLANILASDCPQLETIDIQSCNNISYLDIDNTFGIKFFRLWNDNATNMASRFSLAPLTSLEELHLSNIEHFTRMDMRNMPMLRVLNVQRNNLSTKALTSINCTGLTNLRELSYNNSPDSLYLDGCTSLHKLTLNGGSLKVAELTGLTSLDSLEINNTALTELTLPDLPSLLYVSAYRNENMQMLNIPGENKVEDLILNGNKLTFHKCTLNVAETLRYLFFGDYYSFSDVDSLNCCNYPLLENVRLGGISHDLTSLNFSGCTNLKAIVGNSGVSQIKKVNLEGCSSLVVADFQRYSGLNSLNIAGCESIRGLDLYNCDFDAVGLESLLDQLPALDYYDGLYRIEGCPGESTCDLSAAVEKKWTKTTNDISVDDYDL